MSMGLNVISREGFYEEIRNEINALSQKQCVRFAWLCAAKSLPFLGVKEDFTYWHKKDRERYLISVLHALDVAYIYEFSPKPKSAETASFSYSAYSGANSAAHYIDERENKPAYVVAYTAAYAAYAAYAAANSAAKPVANASYDVFYAFANIISTMSPQYMYIIRNDIESIKSNDLRKTESDITIYGDSWYVFLHSLNKISCGYWSKWYENLFVNRFDVNENNVRRRINAPDEIKKKGMASVGHYLEELGDSDVERLNEARIIILGEKGAGKTSLARRLVDITAKMPNENESTEGVTVLQWRINDNEFGGHMHVHVWDFAGHTITHAAHRCFMSSRALYIYVYDGRVEHNNRPEYWLEQIKIYSGDSPALFLINEKDGHKPLIEKKTLKDDYPFVSGYYNVNIGDLNTANLEAFRQSVIKMVRNNPAWNNQEMRADAYRIKEDLRNLFLNNKVDFITHETFNSIADKQGALRKDYNKILEHLNTLGICLWYNTPNMRDFNNLVLNPDWITHGIYRIINWGHNQEKHILSVDDGKFIFTNIDDKKRYPKDKIRFLFKLMREFELAFFENERENVVFVPLLLSPDRPDELPSFRSNDRLTMIYEVRKALPPNIASRLIVRRYREINNEKELWRKGAVLHYDMDNTEALIIESDRTLTVQAKGKNKTPFIVNLRETLNDIFKSYEQLNYELSYELIVPPEVTVRLADIELYGYDGKLMESANVINAHLEEGISLFAFGAYIPLKLTEHAYSLTDPARNARSEIKMLMDLIETLRKQIELLSDEKAISKEERMELRDAVKAYEAEIRKEKPNKVVISSVSKFIAKATGNATISRIINEILCRFPMI
jgi:GTPase SAR1 family protein